MEELKNVQDNMSEHYKKEEQVQPAPETPKASEPEDNLVLAERMIEQLLPSFYQALEPLSKKEMKKLLKLVVQFPFVDVNKFKLNDKQKFAFMFADRLVYANMVKRARAELDRTFGKVEEEIKAEEKSEELKGEENV